MKDPSRRHWLGELRYQLKRHPFLYRVRYALVLRAGDPDGLRRRPGPVDTAGVPAAYAERVAHLDRSGGSFASARRISRQLSVGHPRGPGLGFDSVRALRRIERSGEEGGAGVCSDYTQVFLGLCTAAGVPAREWGLCDSFSSDAGGVGHALAEVWADEYGKWVFLDPFYALYAEDGDGVPFSVQELVELTAAGQPSAIRLRDIDPEGAAGERRERYVERYFAPERHFFLLVNNDVFRQDRYLRLVGRWPIPLVHVLMLAGGVYPRFHLVTGDARREVWRLRWWLVAVLAGVAGILLLGAQASRLLWSA